MKPDKRMSGNPAKAYHHPRMLNGIILVQEPCPHGAHIFPLAKT